MALREFLLDFLHFSAAIPSSETSFFFAFSLCLVGWLSLAHDCINFTSFK